jgi:hypothetical protein
MPSASQKAKKNLKDSELIRKINSGREDLFLELVRRYDKSLYNFGLRKTMYNFSYA